MGLFIEQSEKSRCFGFEDFEDMGDHHWPPEEFADYKFIAAIHPVLAQTWDLGCEKYWVDSRKKLG